MSSQITPEATPGGPQKGEETVLDAIFSSLFQPGLNTVTQRIMNYSFYGLFLSLLLLLFLSGGNPHVVALLVLSVGLYAGVNWFLHELEKLPQSTLEIQKMPSPSTAESTSDAATETDPATTAAEAVVEGKKDR